ncbi:MAG TPA: hypothetical protein VNK48_15310 [Xanthobacteraceae bacterium]|nr:hypothetical protein [Xanthobacteraceae bacterium]
MRFAVLPFHLRQLQGTDWFKLVREVRECWRECPSGECRRNRCCVSEKYQCRDLHRVPRTPEEEAAILADFHRALQRRRAELRAEEEG